MLTVFGTDKNKIGEFEDYDSFVSFIASQEKPKRLQGRSGWWGFACYSAGKLHDVCARKDPGYLTIPQLKSLEDGLGLIEIRRGDCSEIQEIPITSEISIEDLRKKFCVDYCQDKRWLVIEFVTFMPSLKVLERNQCVACSPVSNDQPPQREQANKHNSRLKEKLDCRMTRLKQNLRFATLTS